ncbi:MAG: purine-nucleoside phosphorylase [Chloroflexi bacterium]|nr:purine-nucleoside phosphorylase [Chloroflexota bacterium]MBU1749538.1 purine-nucleoside phosphorylase [Chloroflexota bacterium]
MTLHTREHLDETVAAIRQHTAQQPQIGLILGSGLGDLADAFEHVDRIPYRDIPYYPDSTAQGHAGELVIGQWEGCTVMTMRGRLHFYEGYSMAAITFPVRVMWAMGVHTLVVTNAAGGLVTDWEAGDLMLITDQINLPGMAGHGPLTGPNDDTLGPRFLDVRGAYDVSLQGIARRVARAQGLTLREGVYVMNAGPCFETPAEIAFMAGIGGNAVGMSTAPEVVVARHAGMRVLGISCITNIAIGADKADHEEVLAMAASVKPRFSALIRGILRELA